MSTTAEAGSATITWTAPDKNEDGTTLTDLVGYRVLYGQSPSALTQSVTLTNPGLRSYKIDGLAAGKWHFAMTALAGSGATARESARTNLVNKDVVDEPPAAPVVTDTLVYQVTGVTDHFQLAPVGTIPLGTTCDPAQTVNGRMAVPRAQVTWYGSVRPRVVVAVCQ